MLVCFLRDIENRGGVPDTNDVASIHYIHTFGCINPHVYIPYSESLVCMYSVLESHIICIHMVTDVRRTLRIYRESPSKRVRKPVTMPVPKCLPTLPTKGIRPKSFGPIP
jgi:hypothetical protein